MRAEVGRALAGAESHAGQAFTEQRDCLKHTLGNLTLLAGSLNPALSRSPWEVKKAELLRCGQPGLSRELHELEDWAEGEILARGEVLADRLIRSSRVTDHAFYGAVEKQETEGLSVPATATDKGRSEKHFTIW